jgi:DNA-binding transcriptional MerR regulator
MAPLLTIGEFSRMTHLSVKALRHYHDMGVLEPAAIDPFTGYRSYDATQVVPAQVIRRLRDLGMPLDSIRSVLIAPDLETRNREIAAHLGRMERQLAQTQASVAGLRALLAGPAVRPAIEYRKIPAVTALAVAQVVSAADLATWGSDALGALSDALTTAGVAPAGASGPFGALFPGDFFELERSEITAFVPVGSPPAGFGPLEGVLDGQVRLLEIPAVEAAIAVHEGPLDDIDRTYAALGTVVAERAIGVDGPIREYYLIGFPETEDESKHRTEVAWPVFLTG